MGGRKQARFVRIPLRGETIGGRIRFHTDSPLILRKQPYRTAWQHLNGSYDRFAAFLLRSGNAFKGFGTGIKAIDLIIIRLQPKEAVFVFIHMIGAIIRQVNPVIELCLIGSENISVKFINAVPCGKPHIPFPVLQNTHYRILGKAFFG